MKNSIIKTFSGILVIALFAIPTLNLMGQETNTDCTDCQNERREKIRGCLRIWGNFDEGEPGGFLATGNKKVCARSENNTCSDNWLTGCNSEVQ